MPSRFVCLNAMPGIGCGFPENLALGIIYILSGILCIIFLIKSCFHKKERKSTDLIERQVQMYWFCATFWLFYRGVLWIVPFNYNKLTFLLFHNGLNAIFFLIPFAFLILILCEILYLSFNPGKPVTIFRIILYVFLSIFLITGVFLSVFVENNDEETENAESPMYLWTCCTNLICLIFITVPSVQLIRSYSYPFPQEEDRSCICTSWLGIIVFDILYIFRIVYNFLQYFNWNPITNIYNKHVFGKDGPTIGTRIYGFFFYLVLDILVIWMANATILTLYRRHISSSREPYYLVN